MTRAQLGAVALAECGVAAAFGAAMAVVVATVLSPLMPIGPARGPNPTPGLAFNSAILGLGALSIVMVFVLRWPHRCGAWLASPRGSRERCPQVRSSGHHRSWTSSPGAVPR